MQGTVVIVGLVIGLIASGLGAADYVLKEKTNPLYPHVAGPPPNFAVGQSSSASSSSHSEVETMSSSASSSPLVVKKGSSTKKKSGTVVGDVFLRLNFTAQATTETSFLSTLGVEGFTVQVVTLLKDNDRAFLFSWVEHDEVKALFSGLKQSLQERFSGKVTNLVDETRSSPNGPLVDILSFSDPELSPENIIFLRVRNRLYEIHVAENGQGTVENLVEELSK